MPPQVIAQLFHHACLPSLPLVQAKRQLRDRTHMVQVRDKHGDLQTGRGAVTRVLKEFWDGVAGGVGSDVQCWCYVCSLCIPDKVRQAMPLLFRDLSEELVVTALERLKPDHLQGRMASPPRCIKGAPKCLLHGLCAPCSISSLGVVSDQSPWVTSLLKCLPKFPGGRQAAGYEDMRPSALQNTCMKLVSTWRLSVLPPPPPPPKLTTGCAFGGRGTCSPVLGLGSSKIGFGGE